MISQCWKRQGRLPGGGVHWLDLEGLEETKKCFMARGQVPSEPLRFDKGHCLDPWWDVLSQGLKHRVGVPCPYW